MQVIYIDTIFFTNLIINYFLLLGTAKICGVSTLRSRLWLGAACGAVYAVLCVFLPLKNALVIVPVAAAMLLSAFGLKRLAGGRRLLRVALVFFALSACAAGAVTAINLLGDGKQHPVSLRVLIISFGACYLVTTLIFRRAGREAGDLCEVKIEAFGRAVTLRALVDTGNSLTDPLSGAKVCVVSLCDILPIIPDHQKRRLEDAARGGNTSSLLTLNSQFDGITFRLVPYSAVGLSSGLLFAFRPGRFFINGKESRDHIVAVSPNEVADNVTYSALI